VGDTIEEIHEGFPTVSIAQIKAILEWYFKHQAEADEYLEEVEAEGEKLRQEIESQPEYIARRQELLRHIERQVKT
jgi:peptidoglycan hydrolase CwlO-like protein